jgi:hypothetical protein
MLIAVLYMLGIGAAGVLVVLVGLMCLKRFKTIANPTVFKSRVRITDGQVAGLKSTWKKCYGAWVKTVLTTRKGLPLNIADVLPASSLDQLRVAAQSDELQGLGDAPIIASFTLTTGAKIDVAMPAEDRLVGLQPWPEPPQPGSAAPASEATPSAAAGT